ncbi:MAG: ATP adenylyltransferase [Acidimicrobiales bacterium]|jgi:ATP adenylyltransferase
MSGFSKAGLDHTEARTDEQKDLMQQIEADGVCPFCAEHFAKYHPKPILKETDTWFVTTNMSPYEGTDYHFLFVYKPKHTNSPTDMTPEEGAELFTLIQDTIAEHNLPGGGFFMRFGEGGYNGSSVEHLHAHLIVGQKKSENTEGLKVKLGYKNKS